MITGLILSCDTPGIWPEHIKLLLQAAKQYPAHWIYLTSDGREHPLHALLSARLVPELVRLIEAGETRMMGGLQAVNSVAVELESTALLNLNAVG